MATPSSDCPAAAPATAEDVGVPAALFQAASAPSEAPSRLVERPSGCACFRRRPTRAAQLAADAALLRGAALGHIETVLAAVQAGANFGTCDKLGDTAMHEAARNGHARCLEALLDCGFETSLPNKRGYTPLHYAAHQGFSACVQALLDAGADVSARVHDSGWTPLHWAASRSKAACAAALVKLGADPLAKGTDGKTPYDLACGDADMVAALTPPPRVAFAAVVFSLPPLPPLKPANGTAAARKAAQLAYDAALRRRAAGVANALRPLPGCAVTLLQQPSADQLAEAVAALTPPTMTLKQRAALEAAEAAGGAAP